MKTFYVTIQSLLLVLILHFLINKNLFNIHQNEDVNLNDVNSTLDTHKVDIADSVDGSDKVDNEQLNLNIQQIPNKENFNDTTETFNAESLKQDLENYLDKYSKENSKKDSKEDSNSGPNPNPNTLEYKKSNFSDDSTELSKFYKLNENIDSEQKEQIETNDNNNFDKTDYEQHVYPDESKMNGSELYDGIHAFDDMQNNFHYFDNSPITSQ